MPITKPKTEDAPAATGHNRVGGIASDQLRSVTDRIERLEEDKAALAADIKDVFAEAKGNGFDMKAIRKILKMRQQDAAQRDEEQAVLELYMRALGMLADTPLGEAAIQRESVAA